MKARPRGGGRSWYSDGAQSLNQIVCPRCREVNAPYLSACGICGESLQPPPVLARPSPSADPVAGSDLPPLLWALVCFFLAVWGLVIAGPVHGLLGFLTHPYVLAGAAGVSLLLTGLFLAEKASRERPPRALLSTRDMMALSWTTAALLASSQAVKFVLPSMPTITRYEMAPFVGDGCRVEVFIKGEEGDEIWRLTGLNRRSDKEIVGIVVRRPGGGSERLPLTEHTPKGDCAIVKYHLMINGRESDNVDGVGR